MTIEIQKEKGRSLEEEFFAKLNLDLKEKLQGQVKRSEAIAELGKVSGIKNKAVLESLIDANINASTLEALSLVPLVRMAWADGDLDPKEKEAIVKAAKEQGVDSRHPAFPALENWLTQAPGDALFETWKNYVRELGRSMSQESFAALKMEIIRRSEGIAKSAGGFLGISSKISAAEKQEQAKIEEAFQIH